MSGCTEVSAAAFLNNTALEEVFDAWNVTTIYSEAFKECKSLKRIEIEVEGVLEWIGSYAFAVCTALSVFPFNKLRGKIGNAVLKNAMDYRKLICTELKILEMLRLIVVLH